MTPSIPISERPRGPRIDDPGPAHTAASPQTGPTRPSALLRTVAPMR
jgi:hypothetical protein